MKRGKKRVGKRLQLTVCPDRTATSHAHNSSGMAIHMPRIMTRFSNRRTTRSVDFPCFDRSKKLPTGTYSLWSPRHTYIGLQRLCLGSCDCKSKILLARSEERACLIRWVLAQLTKRHQHERLQTQVHHRPCLEECLVEASVLVLAVLLALVRTIGQAALLMS